MNCDVELLSPAGDMNCIKAAVQNGADCIYFGANLFSARASAKNFDMEELEEAIKYCKIRGVKTNLTLNILLKDDEIHEAFSIAKRAYECGIDAIIVQDLGLARLLIKNFPDLDIHASTQMSVHNLEGVLELQKLGFKRVVLSRELSIEEIEYIAQKSDIEIEVFVHGALCISYSGQCLLSSIIGGRSGNRGKCAQGCRLPYELVENYNKVLDSGYLLSPRDLCGLDYIPRLINAGVKSFKIEGRLKSPEYVASVTRIYRKYIDKVINDEKYVVEEADKKELTQVFNRGGFSSGHFETHANQDLIFKEKPNNIGIFLGYVSKFNSSKGLITLTLAEPIGIGDTIALENETGTYTISELMLGKQNCKEADEEDTVTIGRMKGKIKVGDKVYKMSSKALTTELLRPINEKEQLKKIPLNCEVKIIKGSPISIHVSSASDLEIYRKLDVYCEVDSIPEEAKKHPLEKEKVEAQISKTTDTPYSFKNIKIKLDDNCFLPNIKHLNELRRIALSLVQNYAETNIKRKSKAEFKDINLRKSKMEKKIALLLNDIKKNENYRTIEGVDRIYIPLKFFTKKEYEEIIEDLSRKFDVFVYLPTIIKNNYKNLLATYVESTIEKYNIQGFVLSNVSNFEFLGKYNSDKYELISNYTFNCFNKFTMKELENLGINTITISPELDRETINTMGSKARCELIVYGRAPLMNMNYCPLGSANHCYPSCEMRCKTENKYYLRDRMNFKFPIVPDNIQTVSTLYNSKITSIDIDDFEGFSYRIDTLEESPEEIQEIINIVKDGRRFEGENYTNGNLNRIV